MSGFLTRSVKLVPVLALLAVLLPAAPAAAAPTDYVTMSDGAALGKKPEPCSLTAVRCVP